MHRSQNSPPQVACRCFTDWLFSILSFTASQEITSKANLQSSTRAAVKAVDLNDVEMALLRTPQCFEDMLLRCAYRMMVIINAQVTK